MPLIHLGPSADSSNASSIPPAIEIRSLAPDDDATAFRMLNEEWITRYFTLEAKDRETLNNPVDSILLKGGHIFMAYAGAEAVGCVALIHMRDGIYELGEARVCRGHVPQHDPARPSRRGCRNRECGCLSRV
jgi:hypothetical protein